MILYNQGKLIGNNYKIIGRLGASGQSVFYKCESVSNNKKSLYFLKIYHDILAKNIEDINKFFMYIKDNLKKSISYFCLPVINQQGKLEIGVEDDSVYVVFPWVEGITLTEYLKNNTSDISGLKSIVLGLLSACVALEKAEIVHLDIKPDNIFLTKLKEKIYIKIIDLDIARINNSGRFRSIRSLSGTPCFRSPEQYNNESENISSKSDVFCMGIILSMLFFRQYPYDGSSEASILNAPSPLPDNIIHPVLKSAILRCLLPNPRNRPSFGELSFVFNQYAGTDFKYKKCGISISDGNHSPYRYWQTIQLSGQDLRGFIRSLPSIPCIELGIDQKKGLYSLTKISNDIEIKLFGKDMQVNKPRFLSLPDMLNNQVVRHNISINGKDLQIYLEEE